VAQGSEPRTGHSSAPLQLLQRSAVVLVSVPRMLGWSGRVQNLVSVDPNPAGELGSGEKSE
jgi:hypothetical protein